MCNSEENTGGSVYLWDDSDKKFFTLFKDEHDNLDHNSEEHQCTDSENLKNSEKSGADNSNGVTDPSDSGSKDKKHSGKELDPHKVNFVLSMMQENLSHGRHVEMERLTLNMLHTTMVIGGTVFLGDIGNLNVFSSESISADVLFSLIFRLLACFGLAVLCMISLKFNFRWGEVFDYHKECASGCYYILHRDLIGINDNLLDDDKESKWILKIKTHKKYLDSYDTRLRLRMKPGDQVINNKLDKLPLFMFSMSIMADENKLGNVRARNLSVLYNMVLLAIIAGLGIYICINLGFVVYKILPVIKCVILITILLILLLFWICYLLWRKMISPVFTKRSF